MGNYKNLVDSNKESLYNTVTLEDEEGQEYIFEIIDSEQVGEDTYMALIPYVEDDSEVLESDDELLVLKVDPRDDFDYLVMIEDEEEFNRISKIFIDKLSDEYDIK